MRLNTHQNVTTSRHSNFTQVTCSCTASHNYHSRSPYDIIIIILLLTAIGLSPGGSGHFTCNKNMKLVTDKSSFKSGGLHEKHVVDRYTEEAEMYLQPIHNPAPEGREWSAKGFEPQGWSG
jgi:hypothetical protein